jgi:Fe-S-cluster containining protein
MQKLIEPSEIESEIECIESFPVNRFRDIIHEVGFECDCCGKCCTSEFNDHVFLLDEDAQRIIGIAGKKYLRPAPYFDLCDNLGRFYVMGYALKTKNGDNCIFYSGGRCEHYDIRPRICKIFPYMLHREADEEGNIDFRQIGGLDQHGSYHNEITGEFSSKIIRDVKKYEINFLKQKRGFVREIENYFKKNGLKQSRQMYDRKMRDYEKGNEIEVFVFFKGKLEREIISRIPR